MYVYMCVLLCVYYSLCVCTHSSCASLLGHSLASLPTQCTTTVCVLSTYLTYQYSMCVLHVCIVQCVCIVYMYSVVCVLHSMYVCTQCVVQQVQCVYYCVYIVYYIVLCVQYSIVQQYPLPLPLVYMYVCMCMYTLLLLYCYYYLLYCIHMSIALLIMMCVLLLLCACVCEQLCTPYPWASVPLPVCLRSGECVILSQF